MATAHKITKCTGILQFSHILNAQKVEQNQGGKLLFTPINGRKFYSFNCRYQSSWS